MQESWECWWRQFRNVEAELMEIECWCRVMNNQWRILVEKQFHEQKQRWLKLRLIQIEGWSGLQRVDGYAEVDDREILRSKSDENMKNSHRVGEEIVEGWRGKEERRERSFFMIFLNDSRMVKRKFCAGEPSENSRIQSIW